MPPPPGPLQNVLPLLSMILLGAVFTNALHHQITAIPEFVAVLKQWGFRAYELRRMVARGVIFFELVTVFCIALAVGTGITYNRRLGHWAWRAGRYSVLALLIYMQLIIVLYAINNPLVCGCGPLILRIDGWIIEIWTAIGVPRPRFPIAVPILRNVLLSGVALVALTRGRVKKPHE